MLLAHLSDHTTSVDWHRHSSPPPTHLSVAAPNQCTNTTINPANEPFFIDTSASVHISNSTSNFYNLHPILPRVVSIGNIWLNVSCGCHVTLEDMLYIPSAAIHLVSVSALCGSVKIQVLQAVWSCQSGVDIGFNSYVVPLF
ncbi:hypothetical protein PAXRUDRAFT_804601 [Paxillus rubicundulus Ve08.2h10]|uniref:Uncharacterized protein n=1 Tax=Paxillus rubicundulus Ve08.2h10 TaxID=930991 RepID=A0A0D0CIF7_9AGAM|nr:hypothetical protein PAXRUDRAFT_804601 [Paxillus rubicundulus Ve08.2h10]